MAEFPALESIVGATDAELDWLLEYYRQAYDYDYTVDVAIHRERETPRHRVALARYALATTSVINGEFSVFVEDCAYHGGAPFATRGEIAGSKSTWRAPIGPGKRRAFFAMADDDDASWLDHPVTCVDWTEALRFCHWLSTREGLIDPSDPAHSFAAFEGLFAPRPDSDSDSGSESDSESGSAHRRWPGYRLPTSAEWEAAGRFDPAAPEAPNEAPYWWGERLEDGEGRCNVSDGTSRGRYRRWITCPWQGTHVHTSPAGSYEAAPSGLFDMAGNVWEWCLDTFAPQFYARCAESPGPVADPLCLLGAGSESRIARGGGWHNLPANIRQASRRVHEPGRVRCNLGFRLARSL